jgi:hypothetical protein
VMECLTGRGFRDRSKLRLGTLPVRRSHGLTKPFPFVASPDGLFRLQVLENIVMAHPLLLQVAAT